MRKDPPSIEEFLGRQHPFDLLDAETMAGVARAASITEMQPDEVLFTAGTRISQLYVVLDGEIDLSSTEGEIIARFHVGDSFGARGMLREGPTPYEAKATAAARLITLPKATFLELLKDHPSLHTYYDGYHTRPATVAESGAGGEMAQRVGDVMTRNPVVASPDISVRDAAALIREHNISCLLIGSDAGLDGIVTTSDLTSRVIAEGLSADTPLRDVMTREPLAFTPSAFMVDALLAMSERRIGHIPVVDNGKPIGIVTRTNLIRLQSVTVASMVTDIGRQSTYEDLAAVVSGIPKMLAQLVGSGLAAYKVAHLITNVADALTQRLLSLAEEKYGPPPVPYLWLACGSQGRQEQTGVSDQDNCLFLDNSYDEAEHGAYFKQLAQYVSDGLDAAGYYYCPGDMMATNPKWTQPVRVWQRYFQGWINKPDPMAQMLSSVMFDLRPISGETSLFKGLQRATLDAARKNSIFRAHMISNSLKHYPPLNLLRGFALIRSGEHKNTVDLKHNGIVPIVDLARMYSLEGGIEAINTRERIQQAREVGAVSQSGATDLLDAYDLICQTRLEHQATQIREGKKPDNFMAPNSLSALERNHLKDAFMVIKTLQSSLSARGA